MTDATDVAPNLPFADVRNVLIEYPTGIKLRFGSLTIEAAARLLDELGKPQDAPAPSLPSVKDVHDYLVQEARIRPVKTSEIHKHFLGRRYYSRVPDKATYNAMKYRLQRAREAIQAGADWDCLVALADDDSGEDTWFLTPKAPEG